MRDEMIRRVTPLLRSLLVLATLAGLAIPAQAQLGPGPQGRAPFDRQPPPRNEAGRFDYYAMVLSWSPTHCAASARGPQDPQCNPRDGRSFAFVLHGLWPQHERGFPESCPTRERPFVPQATIDRMLDIMPSPGLVVHEYRKHGTCSGLAPDAYYDLSRRLFYKVKIPPRYERPNQAFFVTPGEVTQDFVSVNAGLKPEMLGIVCGGPGGRLREVRVCFSREGEFRACGGNEAPRRLCSLPRMFVPPVRAAAPVAPGPGRPPQRAVPPQQPPPGPADVPGARGERRI
jgi:ribonuclease T2